jgi:hypothetical protein
VKYDRMVVAYHGCGATTAESILSGKPRTRFKASENHYDWLGHGVYFWEFGYDRALRFAKFQMTWKKFRKPAVVGAVVQLGNCFDLLDTRSTAKLAKAYSAFVKSRPNGANLPVNAGKTPEKKFRHLDCAVLNFYLTAQEDAGKGYDSVRGAFIEGERAFPSSEIYKEAHIQIAVRNQDCILGVFRP